MEIEQFQKASVEAFDQHENKWSNFPSLLSPRKNHTTVSISNKMFMIGGWSDYIQVVDNFKVFERVNRKFTYIKIFPNRIEYVILNQTDCIG